MEKIANNVHIALYANCIECEYKLSIDEDGQIVITPQDPNCAFNFVTKQSSIEDGMTAANWFCIHLNATMLGDNTDYFVDIDEIGQIIITPESEETSFESVTEGEDLNLTTEDYHIQHCEECIEEDFDIEGEPYTREQLEDDLRSRTNNWTIEDTLKSGFVEEHEIAMEILSQHYETVYDEGKKGSWYYIRFVGPMSNDDENKSLNEADNTEVAKKAFLDMFGDVEKQIEDLMDKWEELKKTHETVQEQEPLNEEVESKEEDQFVFYFPYLEPKVINKERAIRQLEFELDMLKKGSGAELAGRGFGIYCLQSVDNETGTVWTGRHTSKEFLKCISENMTLTESDGQNVMTINIRSGIAADGCEIIVSNDNVILFNEHFHYGYNASYSRDWASDDKPFIGDVVNNLCATYNINKDDIIYKKGTNVFSGNDVSDESVKHFKTYLNEAVSGKEAMEILRLAKEIGIESVKDLIKFYKEHPSFDEHKLETIKEYRDELGPEFSLSK